MTFEHYRIEGDGANPHGRHLKLYRDGEAVPGVTRIRLEAARNGVQELTVTQIVILDAPVTIEEATQALEEREQAWKNAESLIPESTRDTVEDMFRRPTLRQQFEAIDAELALRATYVGALNTDLAGDETTAPSERALAYAANHAVAFPYCKEDPFSHSHG